MELQVTLTRRGRLGDELYRELRAALGRQLGLSRGVLAGPSDVLVTSGAQQAFDLALRVLVSPGDRVAVEEPGYPPFAQLVRVHGAVPVPVRVDEEGLCAGEIPKGVRLVYATPSHQFPLGTAMSRARRLQLLAWAERAGAAVLEDDYDSEFRYQGRPLEPLQSLDRSGRVLYVGTLSKVLLPTLRLGFLVAPAPLQPALAAAKRLADSSSPPEPQRALAAFIDSGAFARHTRRLLRVYRERREALHRALEHRLGDVLERLPAYAGLHESCRCLDPRLDAQAWAKAAQKHGVALEALAPYCQGEPLQGLAFGFGLVEANRIDAGVRLLRRALPGRRGS
jgi:GntR family transcriptional regulator / MocR family aminotransferase